MQSVDRLDLKFDNDKPISALLKLLFSTNILSIPNTKILELLEIDFTSCSCKFFSGKFSYFFNKISLNFILGHSFNNTSKSIRVMGLAVTLSTSLFPVSKKALQSTFLSKNTSEIS